MRLFGSLDQWEGERERERTAQNKSHGIDPQRQSSLLAWPWSSFPLFDSFPASHANHQWRSSDEECLARQERVTSDLALPNSTQLLPSSFVWHMTRDRFLCALSHQMTLSGDGGGTFKKKKVGERGDFEGKMKKKTDEKRRIPLGSSAAHFVLCVSRVLALFLIDTLPIP